MRTARKHWQKTLENLTGTAAARVGGQLLRIAIAAVTIEEDADMFIAER